LCFSVDYRRILCLENHLANQVIQRMHTNDGAFIPRDFVKGRFIFFAIDNSDFSEDTADGKEIAWHCDRNYQQCEIDTGNHLE